MKYIKQSLLILLVLSIVSLQKLYAASKRIEVGERGAQYHHVQAGDTVGEICQQYFSSRKQQKRCLQQMVVDNPDAFINNSIDRLIAGKRLSLPGSQKSFSRLDKKKYRVKNFSWGQLKTPK